MGFKSVIKNLWARGLQDVMNPVKRKIFIKDFLENYYDWRIMESEEFEKITKSKDEGGSAKVIPKEELLSYSEQLVYRSLRCVECVIKKECVHCKCVVPDNMYDKENTCSSGKWPKMKNPEEWKKYKLTEKFYFKLENYQ